MKKIRKAVIPVAGFGTRFLPQTKAMPKEMLPLVDKPIVQYVVENAVDAGIEQIILITGWHKRAIEDHFDTHFELEAKLAAAGKEKQLSEMRRISSLAEFIYVRQKEARGNGDAILTAQAVVGDEPFVVFWGDEFMTTEGNHKVLAEGEVLMAAKPLSCTEQLLSAYEKTGATILGGLRTDKEEDTLKYGYASGEELGGGLMKVDKIIEKPGIGNAPSNLATLAGFIFTPDIFPALKRAAGGLKDGQELVYVDGLNVMLSQGKEVYAQEILNAEYHDCGSKLGYMKTVVELGLRHLEIGEEFREYLRKLKV
ncbi:MAG: hypothetical protein A2700_00510 [Candidatus Blackburnbacteria bacterium RIFCSPHIGHO2_01_FULL_44_64]|uniref:UTP--glucose-1-phosphate uridylyltransferase n=1 Tax=Candidatus Blackburnbacteria bacterium RIFCSPHIGHO2_02_FULL_44_20 TaxID=1797516 RepID=A0A1G1V5T1_9BACT|nr:MAG: hypothetical protein A2700_00510 [Candidatus Blackburnbacteria bacterium RIFCSPHIGHO2_01_FULL_44_64]OGY10729.1 MAG: hypothetical protein A3D26_02700 [Candidatus Blackburnbacteria bacterium RIFCSPHIGHO2_02_FULL_44_20]OGY11917.1 MAG: hypothetical protein A3E16_03975 [Candidatus Blackburnbacteria bacterium RIFCSPHIGHO2_12_FULL_44_25]OGY13640.1 MAG: hypothetical protein A3A62_00175 [Candidatus Blackburnbacteria bacterium RIFCSPLOWO2_01_FULL_44_43]OGY17087.1 MAG: hypothetical protein A3H88_0